MIPEITETPIPYYLMDAWLGSAIDDNQMRVLMCIARRTYNRGRGTGPTSIDELSTMSGLDRESVEFAIGQLVVADLIRRRRGALIGYEINFKEEDQVLEDEELLAGGAYR